MQSKLILIILFALCITSVGYAQGKVQRPVRQQVQSAKPKKSATSFTISEPDGYINGYGYVDLGLPSGTKWATYNVGAKNPEEYGNYYAWGETSVKKSYSQDNSISYKKTKTELQSMGILDQNGNLTNSYDAASSQWGSTWRMATIRELNELNDMCSWTKGRYKGILGAKVTGPNGRSIFLPAAGCWNGSKLYGLGEYVKIWGASTYSYAETQLTIDPFIFNYSRLGDHHKHCGLSIRPVSE